MSFLRRLRDRLSDRRPTIRASRHSFRKPWWRRAPRAWLLLALLLALIGAILLLLQPARATQPIALSTEHPDSV